MPGLADVERVALACTLCPLSQGRTTVVFGEGDPHARLMVVGEGPGREEDLQGRPFVGRSGQLLDKLLEEEAGLARRQVYIANVVKCRPPGNRDPLPDEIASCRPYLDQQIELIGPRVVLTLGNFATRALLGTNEGISRLRGRTYPFGPGAVLVPTFHPAAALRGGGEVVARMRADIVRARQALDGGGASGESSTKSGAGRIEPNRGPGDGPHLDPVLEPDLEPGPPPKPEPVLGSTVESTPQLWPEPR